MVASCCRFLCYFCRISRHNQGALFDHLSYLLENSSVGLGKSYSLTFMYTQCSPKEQTPVECTIVHHITKPDLSSIFEAIAYSAVSRTAFNLKHLTLKVVSKV